MNPDATETWCFIIYVYKNFRPNNVSLFIEKMMDA